MRPYIKLLTLVFLTVLAVAEEKNETSVAIKETKLGKVKVTKDYKWYPNATGVADKAYRGSWSFRRAKSGKSILVKLYSRNFIVGSFDGQSYREIAFQLSPETKAGDVINLKLIAKERKIVKEGDYSMLGDMKDGEIVGMAFGNPRWGNVDSIEIAKVKVISIEDGQVKLHLRLKAAVEKLRDFDIDEEFIVAIDKSNLDNKRK